MHRLHAAWLRAGTTKPCAFCRHMLITMRVHYRTRPRDAEPVAESNYTRECRRTRKGFSGSYSTSYLCMFDPSSHHRHLLSTLLLLRNGCMYVWKDLRSMSHPPRRRPARIVEIAICVLENLVWSHTPGRASRGSADRKPARWIFWRCWRHAAWDFCTVVPWHCPAGRLAQPAALPLSPSRSAVTYGRVCEACRACAEGQGPRWVAGGGWTVTVVTNKKGRVGEVVTVSSVCLPT